MKELLEQQEPQSGSSVQPEGRILVGGSVLDYVRDTVLYSRRNGRTFAAINVLMDDVLGKRGKQAKATKVEAESPTQTFVPSPGSPLVRQVLRRMRDSGITPDPTHTIALLKHADGE